MPEPYQYRSSYTGSHILYFLVSLSLETGFGRHVNKKRSAIREGLLLTVRTPVAAKDFPPLAPRANVTQDAEYVLN
jgi:hypothetical protein